MSSRPDPPVVETALILLALVALTLIIAHHQARDAIAELEVERRRRDELETRLRTREQQLDGALGKINELAPDERDGAD